MLRRVALRRMAFSAGGGSAIRMEKRPSASPTPPPEPEGPAGVYLPWTARPWPVTHSVHHAQWKFLDTVFSHLSTVTPAELTERAREQGARDVLRDLEEPVVGLQRQQARTARQLRRQARTAQTAEQRTAVKTASMDAAAAQAEIFSAAATDGQQSSGSGEGDRVGTAVTEPQPSSVAAAEIANEVAFESARVSVAASSSSTSSATGGKRKRTKKSKLAKQSVDVIHYL